MGLDRDHVTLRSTCSDPSDPIFYFTGLSGWFLSTTADNPENAETEGDSVAGMKGD
jgi:hypothetical protein